MDKETWLRNGISNNLIDRRGVVPPRDSTIEDWLGETIQRGVGNIYQLSGLAAALNPRIELKGGPGKWTGEYLPPLSNDWVLKRDENRLSPRVDNGYPSPGYILGPDGKIMAVKDTRNVNDKFGKDAVEMGASAPDKRDRPRKSAQVDTAFRFSSSQPKSSAKVADSSYWLPAEQQTPTYNAPGGGRVTAYQDDPLFGQATPAPKTNRGGKPSTVAVDPFSGKPIQATSSGNTAVRQAMTRQQADGFRETMGARAMPLVAANEPSGAFMIGKDGSRLTDNAYAFIPGEQQNPALGAIDGVTTVAMPRKRPNIEANPGMRLDTGLMGVPMSQGMSERLAGGEAMGMVPGVSIVRNPRVFQALAAQQQAAPAPAAPAAPSQGTFVDPNTSTGSTLQGLGFSSGTVVPAAAIRNLTERGYL
jgi:hypothetical protein